MTQTLPLATRFSTALDEENYPAAAACLARNCVYETRGETYRGVCEIIGSYWEHGDWATRNLDSVRYESIIREGVDGQIIVEFLDHIEHGGRAHTYRCEQRLTFDDSGRISRIVQVDLPGERDRLRLYFRQVGLESTPTRDEAE